ncbi:MAG TPA: hypothetical protein PLR88_08040 [Bacteroidales bacterium]|nr:hypothetical protein [Bacteroidales bacterium]
MIKVKILKSDMLSTLKLIKAGLKSRGKKAKTTTCELTITDDKLTVTVPGASFFVKCRVNGAAKATMPFWYLFDIVQKYQSEPMEIIIARDQIGFGDLFIGADTTFINNDRILKSIDLPINYMELDLLKLDLNKYTPEELEFNKLTKKIENARKNLESAINEVYQKLKIYGFTKNEVDLFVKSKFPMLR